MKDDGILTVSETESKITNLLVQMHEETKIILEKNSIIQNEKSRIEIVIREILKLNTTFVSLNSSNQWNTEAALKNMKSQLQ